MKKHSTLKDAIKEVATPIEERKYTNVHNKIKNIKNLSKKDADMIANIDPAVLGPVIKALKPMFEEIDEALVAPDFDILRAILHKIEDDVKKLLIKDSREAAFAKMAQVAKLAGYGITKKKQAKTKTFMYKLKK